MGDDTGIERRKRLKQEYGELFDQTSAILFRHDPIGINFEDNTGEYDPEAGTILPRLAACAFSDRSSPHRLRRVLQMVRPGKRW
jgi:hypothetical protein